MKLAITSMAVTASICASISEAALFVACFMPFSVKEAQIVVAREGLTTLLML